MLQMIVTALLPILATLLLGYFAGRHGDFTQKEASVLTRMVMLYALPLLLFSGILSTSLDEVTRNGAVFFWIALAIVGGFIVVFALSRFVLRSDSGIAALRALSIAAPAVNFVGAPVLGVIFPALTDLAIAAGTLVMNVVVIPLAIVLLDGSGAPARAGAARNPLAALGTGMVKAFRQPVAAAPIIALLLLLAGLDMPDYLKGSFALLGHSTGGVALFAVGAVLYAQKVSVSVPVVVNVVAKNVVVPALILAAMLALGIPHAERALVAVTLSLPSASIGVILAVQYRIGEKEIASTLFWSTILSVVTMGCFIWITGS